MGRTREGKSDGALRTSRSVSWFSPSLRRCNRTCPSASAIAANVLPLPDAALIDLAMPLRGSASVSASPSAVKSPMTLIPTERRGAIAESSESHLALLTVEPGDSRQHPTTHGSPWLPSSLHRPDPGVSRSARTHQRERERDSLCVCLLHQLSLSLSLLCVCVCVSACEASQLLPPLVLLSSVIQAVGDERDFTCC
jgi:hypothetical protein